MKTDVSDSSFPQELRDKLYAGVREAIRREVQRRRKLAPPLHVANNGHVETQ